MEQLSREELLYDERAERIRAIRAKRKRKQRRRRRIRSIVLLAVLAGIIYYFASDLSKVRSIRVSGNRFYSQEQICDIASLSYQTRYLLKPGFLIESALQNDSLIESASVKKSWNGVISIEVKEKLIVGYLAEEDGYYVLASDDTKKKVEEAYLNSIVHYPLLNGFDEEQLKALTKAFDSVKDKVPASVMERVSEIIPYQTSYNDKMMKLVMRDGNVLYGSYDAAGLLSAYDSVLKELKGTNVCLYLDEENSAMSKVSCSEFKTSEKKRNSDDSGKDA